MGFLFDYTPEELATFTLEELEILQEADDFFSQADAIKRKKLTLAAMERTNILQEEEDKNLSLGMQSSKLGEVEVFENRFATNDIYLRPLLLVKMMKNMV